MHKHEFLSVLEYHVFFAIFKLILHEEIQSFEEQTDGMEWWLGLYFLLLTLGQT